MMILKEKNFQNAGDVLCHLWNNINFDGYFVKFSYQKPTDEPRELDPIGPKWVEVHCNISKYSLQIIKCDDFSCYEQLRDQTYEQS